MLYSYKAIIRSSRGEWKWKWAHGAVLEVELVADDDEREVLGVARTRLDEELVAPRVERLERVGRRHVVDEHAAVGAAVERDAQRLKTLLARRVPDLHRHQPVAHLHLLRQEVRADRRLVLAAEPAVHVLVHERRLAHTTCARTGKAIANWVGCAWKIGIREVS